MSETEKRRHVNTAVKEKNCSSLVLCDRRLFPEVSSNEISEGCSEGAANRSTCGSSVGVSEGAGASISDFDGSRVLDVPKGSLSLLPSESVDDLILPERELVHRCVAGCSVGQGPNAASASTWAERASCCSAARRVPRDLWRLDHEGWRPRRKAVYPA